MKCFPTALAVLFFAVISSAEAAKPALIGWGEKISELCDIPADENPEPGYKIGLYYNSFRLFFVPVATWDKKVVVFNDAKNEYGDLSAEDLAALEKKVGSLSSKGGMGAMWARYVNWLWPGLIGLFIAKKVIGGRNRSQFRSDGLQGP